MKKEFSSLLTRTAIDEIETQHDAVARLVKILEATVGAASDRNGINEASSDTNVLEARRVIYDLLFSPRLAVVSKACQGLVNLLASRSGAVDIAETNNEVLKALEVALGRQRQHQDGGGGVTRVLTRCLVTTFRLMVVREAREPPDVSNGERRGEQSSEGVMAMILGMDSGGVYPALSHEVTCFLSEVDTIPQEAIRVVGPFASAVLLQAEYANFRGGFLLKLSTALTAARESVKVSLITFQAELLSFAAVHTPAHADIAAAWCCALAATALSLDSDVAWSKASRSVVGVVIFHVAEFRERRMPIAPLLETLQTLALADPLCLAEEVAYLGILALQSPCVDERKVLLSIILGVVSALSRHYGNHGLAEAPPTAGKLACGLSTLVWSLEILIFPMISLAAADHAAATEAVQPIEAALKDLYPRLTEEHSALSMLRGDEKDMFAGIQSLRHCSTAALAARRLSNLGGDVHVMVDSCGDLKRRAGELGRAIASGVDEEVRAAATAELTTSFILLSPLLLRYDSSRIHNAACMALVAIARAIPTFSVRLLPFVLYVERRRGVSGVDDDSVISLQILPELGAHKVAAKPVARVIQALANAPQAIVRGVGVRLAAALINVNSRTFNQLQSLLADTPVDHRPPLPPEPDESRVCRAASMLDVCSTEPELGLECVRSLQSLLSDSLAAVTALALKAIAALCRGDCLDFHAALRIVSKKGKVSHMGRDGGEDEWGDHRVMQGLAQLCGAGAEAVTIAAAEDDSDVSDEDDTARWNMADAIEILVSERVRSHPHEEVRAAAYAALGAHLPALLRATTGQSMQEDAVFLASRLREFLAHALSTDRSLIARSSLEKAASIVLAEESVDPSTWVRSERTGTTRGRHEKAKSERTGPSKRLLMTLPEPESILQTFRRDNSFCAGLAGAVLWSYPVKAVTTAERVARRDAMVRDLGELLAAEGRAGGLALCPWQRAATPLGVQRYVARLLAACFAAESPRAAVSERRAATDVALAAVESCRRGIETLRGVPRGLIALATASVACCVPASFAHVVEDEVDRAVNQLRVSLGSGKQAPLDGEELYPLCAAMAVRALPESASAKMLSAVEVIAAFQSTVGGQEDAAGVSASAPAGDTVASNEAQTFWSCVAIGVASEWSAQHSRAPDAKRTVVHAVRRLLTGVARATRSDQIHHIAGAMFSDDCKLNTSAGQAEVIDWNSLDVGQGIGSGNAPEVGVPTTRHGSACLALFLGLSSTLPGLRATGLQTQLLQVFHIVRACQEAGVCGAALCLSTAASECLSCGLINSPIVLDCIRSTSLALDRSTTSNQDEQPPAEDTCLGAAGLVAACEGKVILPPGFTESMFESLRKAAAHRRGADSGVRVTSLLALASMVGCPLLGLGEYAPRRMQISSAVDRRTVEILLEDIREIMERNSLRPKNAAARVWGCLSAVGQDERSLDDAALRDALGWSDNGTLGTRYNGRGGGGGGGGTISAGALHVAREGTLMNVMLTRLQAVATGVPNVGDDVEVKSKEEGERPLCPSLFVASAMACLKSCTGMRVPHADMATVIEAVFRGGHGVNAEVGCMSLALTLADKDPTYSAWLRGLCRGELFGNLSTETRLHLVSTFDQIVLKVPSEVVGGMTEEVWSAVASTWVAASIERPVKGGSDTEVDSKVNDQAAAFLSSLGRLLASSVGDHVEVVRTTAETIWPSILGVLVARNDVALFNERHAEQALMDALVRLFSSLPPQDAEKLLAFQQEAIGGSAEAIICEKAIKGHLISRLVAPQNDHGKSGAGALLHTSTVTAASAGNSGLRSVAKWATSTRTDRRASAAVLPYLAERLRRVESVAAKRWWLQTLLDMAELPETCPMRAIALVSVATAILEPWNAGVLVTGEKACDLLGPRIRPGDVSFAHATGVVAPQAVSIIEKTSSGVSAEVLRRLFRLSGLLRKRRVDEPNRDRARELQDVSVGVEGFVRGLRHAPPVVEGTLSKQFASFAERVAASEALRA